MSSEILKEVAVKLSELQITYEQADRIASVLLPYFDVKEDEDWFTEIASNAPKSGECGC